MNNKAPALYPVDPNRSSLWSYGDVEIACGSREAMKAAYRLLFGECERSLRAAQHLRSLNNTLEEHIATALKDARIVLV